MRLLCIKRLSWQTVVLEKRARLEARIPSRRKINLKIKAESGILHNIFSLLYLYSLFYKF